MISVSGLSGQAGSRILPLLLCSDESKNICHSTNSVFPPEPDGDSFGVGLMTQFYIGKHLNGGDVAQEVRAVVWQSEGCRFDPTLGVSKCPWARNLTPNCSWRTGWYLAWQPIACWCVNVCEWGINCTALWIKVLYKCSPFTIYFCSGHPPYLLNEFALNILPLPLNTFWNYVIIQYAYK